jgi:hypothetical protein
MYNLGFGTFQKTEQEIGNSLGETKIGYWEAMGANVATAWDYNPSASLFRMKEQIQAYQDSKTYLNKDELNKEYGELGLHFKEDTREGVVDYLVKRKLIEQQRSQLISRGPSGNFAQSTFFLASMGTSFFDPINIGASFIPVVGQARFAGMVARSGKNVARMKKGFVEGLVGNAAVEPIVYGVAQSEQSDYDQYDAFTNIAAGGFLGSAFHVGIGRLGDFIAEKRGKPNIYQRLAAISPENQQALLKYTIGKHLKGEKVDTGDLIVNKSRIGDEQLTKLDEQILEYKGLYKKALDNGDRKSAKTYLQILRNLQKEERAVFEAKKKANDDAIQNNKTDFNVQNEKGELTEIESTPFIEKVKKSSTEIEREAEDLSQRNKFHQKQLDIKDEDLKDTGILEDRLEIENINKDTKNKITFKEAIRAGANCMRRGT